MKNKTLLSILAAAVLALGILACSGVNPLSSTQTDGLPGTPCPDFSGTFLVNMADHNNFDVGMANVVITQQGNQITMDLVDAAGGGFTISLCGPLPTGTIDCINGTFTLTASSNYGLPLVVTGTINRQAGTIAAVATGNGGTDAIASSTPGNSGGFTHCDGAW